MATLEDPQVHALLAAANHAVLTTYGPDGSAHSTVVWQEVADGKLSVNSSQGRQWPTNLERDPRATVVVMDQANPYEYVEIRGTAVSTRDGAEEQIHRLAKKYINADRYPWLQDGEVRIRFDIAPEKVRHQKVS